ncbi:unnamed protein product, partial [Arabidopsis halleri]
SLASLGSTFVFEDQPTIPIDSIYQQKLRLHLRVLSFRLEFDSTIVDSITKFIQAVRKRLN